MSSTPRWFLVISVVALLWNLLGLLAVVADVMMSPEEITRLSADQQALYAARTWWSTTASLVAVLGGSVGSLGLLLRKSWASPFLLASVVGLVVQDVGLFVVADGASLAGTVAIILQLFVFLISLGLVALYRMGTQRHWIPTPPTPAGT